MSDTTMTRVYLSGPMTGLPEFNYPAFHAAAADLRDRGHQVYSPAEFSYTGETFPMREAFSAYCSFICNEADGIVMLPGWEKSKGAGIEHALASYLGLSVEHYIGRVTQSS